ncbi:MAG: hypothetical protein J3R72DRAFT_486699 [Linnemannia gamsii]|nr:MAG: hypothetical protein J3R72DRAFT_486699 [Linnemannia gamsii]
MQQQAAHNHNRPLFHHHHYHHQMNTALAEQQWNDSHLFLLDMTESFLEPQDLSLSQITAREGSSLPRQQITSAWRPSSKTCVADFINCAVELSNSLEEPAVDSSPSSNRFSHRLLTAIRWCFRMVMPCLQRDYATDHIQL